MGHGGIDRRDSKRQSVNTTLWIAGLRGEGHQPLSVSDLSLDGLAFRSHIRWFEGDPVWVSVNVDRPLEITGTVVRCAPAAPRYKALARALSEPVYDVAISYSELALEVRRELVGQIFRTEVYARGLLF